MASISGLVSGIDTDSLVTQLMAVERRPITLIQNQNSLYTLEQQAFQDINTRLSTLLTNAKTLTSLSSNVFDQINATSSDTSILTGTAGPSAVQSTYNIKVLDLATTQRIASDDVDVIFGSDVTITDPLNISGTFNLSVGALGNFNVNVANTESLTDIMNNINSDTNNDDGNNNKLVNASIIDETLVLETVKTGAVNTITIADTTNTPAQDLGLITGAGANKNVLQANQDASFDVNGIQMTRSDNTGLTDVISGITLNLAGESTLVDTAQPRAFNNLNTTTLTVAPDDDAVVTAIQDFVDQYNSTYSFITDLTKYDAATQTAGTLLGDSTATRIQNGLASTMTQKFNEAGMTFQSLFEMTDSSNNPVFTLGDINSSQQGQIILDETALRDALTTDRQSVKDLFVYDNNGDGVFDTGVAKAMEDYITPLTQFGGLLDSQDQLYQDLISSNNDRISNMEDNLAMREKALRRKFTSMEMQMSTLTNMSGFLAGQLSNLSATLPGANAK